MSTTRYRTLQRNLHMFIALGLLACGHTPKPSPDPSPAEPAVLQPDPPKVRFVPTELPLEAVVFYGEAAAFSPLAAKKDVADVDLDLSTLLKRHRAEGALLVPYDSDNFYEPIRGTIKTRHVRAALPLDKNVLVVLELGPIAVNNYLLINQLSSFRDLLPIGSHPQICRQILCSNNTFRADRLWDRVSDLAGATPRDWLPIPPVDVGAIGAPATLCDRCFERQPSVLPCLFNRCKLFPLPRKVRVRKNVYSLSEAEVASLRAGVAAMQEKPATDPTSWVYQAKMHAVNSGPVAAFQGSCQHRQFFFLSWHRMFTYYFERILRKASGDNALNLPYWNYSDDPAQLVIPAAYREPADAGNPLYNSTRNPVYNLGAALPAADVSYANAFASTLFTSATSGGTTFGGGIVAEPSHFGPAAPSGLIERSPHNNVHNDVSGDMATGESPRDPLFWLHHANIDRLWNKWIALGAGREHPTGITNWMNQTFWFFDENGAEVSLTGAKILSTVRHLGYRYDDDPYELVPFWQIEQLKQLALPFGPLQHVVASEDLHQEKKEIRLTDKALSVAIRVPAKPKRTMQRMIDEKVRNERYLLELRGIRFDKPVGVTYLIFLNLAAGEKNPDHTHPSFVGTLGFFGSHHEQHGVGAAHSDAGAREAYDITEIVRRQGRVGDFKLTFVPSYPVAPPDRPDLKAAILKLKPQGQPRISEIVLLKQHTRDAQ